MVLFICDCCKTRKMSLRMGLDALGSFYEFVGCVCDMSELERAGMSELE